jgi:hypothetical protein
VIDVLKLLGAPGSIPFLLLAVLAGLALFRSARWRPTGLAWLAAVGIVYAALAMPVVAHAIADALPAVESHQRAADVLIVLDGDNRRGRVRELARILGEYRPKRVWVLGDRWILEVLAEAGVSRSSFQYDRTARTTRAQIDQVQAMAATEPGAMTIVASRLQAPRVAALLRTKGLPAAVRAAPLDAEPSPSGWMRFVPSYSALRTSRDALYEHAALAYYQWQGWIP